MAARILLVDDDTSIRNSLYTILERDGYEVLAAGNGEEALRAFRQAKPPIEMLITDYNMPGMSGVELACECSRLQDGLKVLYVSGSAADGALAKDLKSPNRAFLSKPFRRHDLLRSTRELLLTELHEMQLLHS